MDKDSTIKIDKVFRKSQQVRKRNIGKRVKIFRRNIISDKIVLTDEEKLKVQTLFVSNYDEQGFILMKEFKKDLFSSQYLKDCHSNSYAATVRRGVAISYHSGIAIDFCVDPHFVCDEYYFITHNSPKSEIFGIMETKDDKYNIILFKKPLQAEKVMDLGSKGALSSSNIKQTILLENSKQLEDYLKSANFIESSAEMQL